MGIYLIYASTSGNVEVTMEYVSGFLKKRGFEVFLSRAERTPIEVIEKHKKFVFGTSTWQHGNLNPFFMKLYEEMKNLDFRGKQAAFVGLGDRRYEPILFCEGIVKIRHLFLKNGGEEVGNYLKIQGEPYGQLNSVVAPWAAMLSNTWANYHV